MAYDDAWKVLAEGQRVSHARPLVSTIYFVTFILLGTMIMLNLFTGVIITSMEEAQDEAKTGGAKEQLKDRGFLTLHDELNLVSTQMQQILHQMSALQERAAQIQVKEIYQPKQPSGEEFY